LLSAQGDTSVATVPNDPADGSEAISPSVPPAASLEQQLVTNQQKQQSNGQPPQQQGGDAAAEVLEQQQQQAATPEPKKPSGNFIKRVIAGVVLGLGGAAVVAVGNLPYLLVAMLVVYQATQEYYGFITSKGISAGMTPPPPFVSAMTTALCLSITVLTYVTRGKSGTAMSVAAFVLLAMNILVIKKPTFSQLTSSVFGLFYCGYLPSFWVKLRNLSISTSDMQWPALFLNIPLPWPQLTVGLVACLTSVACIIAADTGAYFVGKNLGRTPLTQISPKKTVEGAVGGMASAVLVSLLFWKIFGWPGNMFAAAGYGVLTFFSSLFGDLIESIMKRDAGMKDSGDLIPGHGGLLDRFDSYMFSGAIAYFYITFLLPRFGLV